VDKRFLEDCLAKRMSLEAIGDLTGKHPSTVSYWLKKHGLALAGAEKYTGRGPLCQDELKSLASSGATLAEMAERLDRSISSVRYWLARYGIRSINSRGPRRRHSNGAKIAIFECRRHGLTEFTLEGRGHYRCKRCRSTAVVNRRRMVKEKLVEEAGGACVLCGYGRWVGALQFHHVDPSRKEFNISQRGHSRSLTRSRAEVRKCVLLCANCHAEVEGGVRYSAG
jgi:DNA-binding transcriptional ArsR family regulator